MVHSLKVLSYVYEKKYSKGAVASDMLYYDNHISQVFNKSQKIANIMT